MEINVIIKGQPMMQPLQKKDGTTTNKYFFIGETVKDKYQKKVCFTCVGDEIWNRLGIVTGHTYVLSIDVSSHEYNGRWYTDVSVWKAVDVSTSGAATSNYPQSPL